MSIVTTSTLSKLYIKFGSQFPQHERVPDAMLKLGATYQQLWR